MGMQLHKVIFVRGAPADSLDVRITFAVYSRMYNDAMFFVRVKRAADDVLLCESADFVLEKKERKK